ncbi:ferritin [Candidatus Woesearchaeota archaeon]|nr:ferritin [Candidatus Woesearchaeota archaeon]
MGTVGRKIAGKNVDEIINLMNKALADEWLAYYQYWVGAQVVKGPMRAHVEAELKEHAEEELKHANMLSKRIIQLGGTPILNPSEWVKLSNCKYDEPKDPHVMSVLKQNIKGEQCAIAVYKKLLEKVMASQDFISVNMVRKIMEDEVEHEDDLEALKEDLELTK